MKKQFIYLFILSITIVSCNGYGKKLEYDGTEVYYKGSVKKEEAEKLGQFLIRSEFTDGNRKSVQLTKDDELGLYAFRMVTNKKAQEDKSYDVIFKILSMQVSDSILNKSPVDFHVCDNTFETVRIIPFVNKTTE
tara:strand:+ start:56070 stop:56474 length:405 start_codon:yes stop_codon:yes gene_type:complete